MIPLKRRAGPEHTPPHDATDAEPGRFATIAAAKSRRKARQAESSHIVFPQDEPVPDAKSDSKTEKENPP